jgi:hypothetical protein
MQTGSLVLIVRRRLRPRPAKKRFFFEPFSDRPGHTNAGDLRAQ